MSLLSILQLLLGYDIDSVVDPVSGKVFYFDPITEKVVHTEYTSLK